MQITRGRTFKAYIVEWSCTKGVEENISKEARERGGSERGCEHFEGKRIIDRQNYVVQSKLDIKSLASI